MSIKGFNSKFLEQSLLFFSLCLHNIFIGRKNKSFSLLKKHEFNKHEAENCLKSKKHVKNMLRLRMGKESDLSKK